MPGYGQAGDTLILRGGSVVVDSTLSDSARWAQHSPHKASLYSALCPGLGQIYNKKYWKVPIVYLGFASLAGSAIYNANNYKHYKKKYIYMLDNGLKEYKDQSIPEVKWYKDTHKRYRDLFIIVTAGFYALQIIDASVDAYLINFDVSDDLSMRVSPVMIAPATGHAASLGVSCCLSF